MPFDPAVWALAQYTKAYLVTARISEERSSYSKEQYLHSGGGRDSRLCLGVKSCPEAENVPEEITESFQFCSVSVLATLELPERW